ncbi:MAG TPA: diacylglycerol kinase, partial [Candidatus Binatia bacterium]|nr:diacylglycerol kinase [Candidatus Binatia bacterium]
YRNRRKTELWRNVTSMKDNHISPLQRLINASKNSLNGLTQAWHSEASLRYEVYVLILVIPAGLVLGRNAIERALMIGSALLVVVVEMLNTAIETVVDRISEERHKLSGLAKDLGSAGVLCSIVLAVVVWGILLLG